jgi:hypothetical protein
VGGGDAVAVDDGVDRDVLLADANAIEKYLHEFHLRVSVWACTGAPLG